jgi:hypothetical protein
MLVPAATPAVSPNGGSFHDSVKVTLASTTANSKIYYTFGNTILDTTKTLYSTPFWLKATTIVKARAYAAGFLKSDSIMVTFLKTATTVVSAPSINAAQAQNSTKTIYDMLGRRISSSVTQGVSLKRGVYFVQYRSGDKIETRKYIIQK